MIEHEQKCKIKTLQEDLRMIRRARKYCDIITQKKGRRLFGGQVNIKCEVPINDVCLVKRV